MEGYVTDWLSLLTRWVHVIAGIAWIGHAFLFHSFEHGLRRPEGDDVSDDVEGELWMVHGGGFFRLQKTRVLPDTYTGQLLWFKWEAAFTWLSGVFLLVLVYHLHGSQMLAHAGRPLGGAALIGIGVGTMVVGWIAYDLVWSLLGKQPAIASAFTVALIAGATVGLSQVMNGRAAFIHVGALMGTIMTANVWMRILPGMRKMIAALEAGREPDLGLGAIGKQRSLHNGYMHFPIIFIMISSHFTELQGHDLNWLVLIAIMVFGASMRQVLYDGLVGSHIVVKGLLAVSVAGLVALTAPLGGDDAAPVVPAGQSPIDAQTTGTIGGVVSFVGQPPPAEELQLFAGCETLAPGKVYDEKVMVEDGKLANALVWIRDGWQPWKLPPPPDDEVMMDQRTCIYRPRVAGVRVGQPVTFVNSDPIFHNVRTKIGEQSLESINMPIEGQRETRRFKRPEMAIQALCDLHPWMRGYIGVSPHPWFAVTGADGSYSLQGVPPGEYVVEAWHEVYGTRTQTVTVAPSGQATATFSFAAGAR